MSSVTRIFMCLWPLFVANFASAARMDGAAIVRLDDGFGDGHCISSQRDAVSVHLRRLIVTKESGFFTSDYEFGIVLNTTIVGYDLEAEENSMVEFPRAFRTPANNYAAGLVSLPIEMRVASRYPLLTRSGSHETLGLDLDFTLVRKKERGTFGVALEKLADLSDEIIPPANPYGKAFRTFASFAGGLIDDSLTKNGSVDKNVKGGNVSMTFSPDGNCSGDNEKTGTIAVVQQHEGLIGEGVVDIARIHSYCWRPRYSPTFAITVASKPSNGECSEVKSFSDLSNPHYMFVVNARRRDGRESLAADGKSMASESHRRCELHGISLDVC